MSLDLSLQADVDTGGPELHRITLFVEGITHNVSDMWRKAGVIDALYESHDKRAGDLIPVLEAGVLDMETKPREYERLNPANGWGDYEGAMRFLRNFLTSCRRHPNAIVRVCR